MSNGCKCSNCWLNFFMVCYREMQTLRFFKPVIFESRIFEISRGQGVGLNNDPDVRASSLPLQPPAGVKDDASNVGPNTRPTGSPTFSQGLLIPLCLIYFFDSDYLNLMECMQLVDQLSAVLTINKAFPFTPHLTLISISRQIKSPFII